MTDQTKNLFSELKDRLGEQNFQSWISPIKSVEWNNGALTLDVPSAFYRDWLQEHYIEILEQISSQLAGQKMEVDFKIGAHPPEIIEAPLSPPEKARKSPLTQLSNLNPKYTFDRFVVGACNQFANAATLAVAQAPGKAYNPLFIYGGVGLGKTHLTQAAARAILDQRKKYKILYLSSESFTNDFINNMLNACIGTMGST